MAEQKGEERRHEPRLPLRLIVRVKAERDGEWVEVATTADASPDGVALVVDHDLAVGEVVRIQLLPPLPKSLGAVRLDGPSPEVWGVVRSARAETGAHRVGILFVDRPAETAQGAAAPSDRRGDPRFPVPISFVVQVVDDRGAVLKEGLGVAENVSRSGAQLSATLGFSVGDVILLQETSGAFEGRAEVVRTWRDDEGILRLHVRFLDGRAPDRLVPRLSEVP